MSAPHGGSEPGTAKQPGWFARFPVWVRVVVSVVLVVLVVLAVVLVVSLIAGASSAADPEAAAQAACEAEAAERLETRGHSGIEFSGAFELTEQADGGYRVQGTATFDDDGETHHADVRCVVRVAGGSADVVSVRFND